MAFPVRSSLARIPLVGAALAAGDAAQAEKLAFALTLLDDARPDGHALLAAALAKQGKQAEAEAAFELAKLKANECGRAMVEVLMATLPRKPVAGPWCEVLSFEPAPNVVTDGWLRARISASKLPWRVRDKRTGVVMLLCLPGKFKMGAPATDPERAEDEHEQEVEISAAFYLSESEVTQEQWKRIMDTNPSRFVGEERPVERVTWDDCQNYCRLSGLRLPTESEWEYACRAGTNGAYSGDRAASAWSRDNSGGSTHPVKQRRSNPWGFFDMHGNVWEWCEDGYSARASGTQTAAGAQSDLRVARGGSWELGGVACRSSYRMSYSRTTINDSVGFRVARAAQ